MNLAEFYELNKSGTRVRLQDREVPDEHYIDFTTDQHTVCEDYEVLCFDATCEDLVTVWVKK